MSERQTIKEDWRYPNLPPKPFTFPTAVSHLDPDSEQSMLNKSDLRGFFNLAVIFGTIFFITQPIINFIDRGYILESTLYNTFKVDFIFCTVNWPLFFLWYALSFSMKNSLQSAQKEINCIILSYRSRFKDTIKSKLCWVLDQSKVIHLLIVKGLSPTIALVLQHLTQTGLFAYSTYVILANDWCSTHAAFIVMQTCVHFMKMHSYITVNRDLREDYEQAKKANRPANSNYPNNVKISDFALFMLTPWLVYAQYPRRSTINYAYLFKKGLLTAVLLVVVYLINSEFIQPWILKAGEISIVQLILRLALPCTIFLLLIFEIVFQNMCNFFAELSRLDSREFYQDWWNSHTYEQFNRKWNKPVHLFLYRHVYLQLIIRYKKSKTVAQIATFLFSAFLHEFLLAVIFRIVRPIFLMFILGQVPLIKFTKWMKQNREGIYLTWFGLIIGPSIIVCSYLKVDQKVTMMFAAQK